jgi:hypothetical protein
VQLAVAAAELAAGLLHAAQNERDYQAFAAAIRSGRLQALEDA